MKNKFTLLLLGPAGSGKSSFVSSLSKIDIFQFITAKQAGGANTTKISVTYEFNNKCKGVKIVDCIATESEDRESLLNELKRDSSEKDGIEKIFKKINDESFSKKCIAITLQLPCEENLFPDNSIFDTIVVRDSRGFGDINDDNSFKINDLGITDDVNTILFFSISSIQQPAIFSKIVENVMKSNLKTPMLLLRRDPDLTQNDIDFKENIINNIKKSDPDLSDIIINIGRDNQSVLIEDLIVNLPEVKQWKGTINVSPSQTQVQISNYSLAVKEIINYAIEMYGQLYELLVKKMQGKYQDKFVNTILQQLKSEKALKVVSSIVKKPCVTPSESYNKDRDTEALSKPVCLNSRPIDETPFTSEKSQRGRNSIIPSYSYSCVNFRNIFQEIIYQLADNYQLASLFNTFMSITLNDSTVTTYTGYSFQDCKRNAFKFNFFLNARDQANKVLKKNGLVINDDEWKSFTYTPVEEKYTGNKAIAVLIYMSLIDSLNLALLFNNYKSTQLNQISSTFVEANFKEDILDKLKRK